MPRQPTSAAWVSRHDRSFFVASKGRSAIGLVWRHSIKSQCSAGIRLEAGSVRWGFRKFYETMSVDRPRDRAEKLDLHITTLSVAISHIHNAEDNHGRESRVHQAQRQAGQARQHRRRQHVRRDNEVALPAAIR